jgi:hypothetical protein
MLRGDLGMKHLIPKGFSAHGGRFFHHDIDAKYKQTNLGAGQTKIVHTNDQHQSSLSNIAYSKQSKLIYTGSWEGVFGTWK